MTFAQYAAKSNSKPRILIQLDIGFLSLEWINCGAGIWYVNANNIYTYVDSSLLDGFTAQGFGEIGSVQVDSALQTQVNTLADLTITEKCFYYDAANRSLYLRCMNSDEPFIHNISLGIIYGYSYDEFTPIGSFTIPYEGRLSGSPSVSRKRDPLFFGRIAFDFGNVQLVNSDGFFDTFAQDNDVYGNEMRVYMGFAELDFSEYIRLYTGYIEKIDIAEDYCTVSVTDKRKQLTREVRYTCTNKNGLEAIRELLSTYYSATYTDDFYDLTAWAAAEAQAESVTIDMQADDTAKVIDIIEDICASMFGLFYVNAENKYSFRFVNTGATASSTIRKADIMNRHVIEYDPTEVISSVKVGYAKDWATSSNPFTYYTDTSREEAVYLKYKTYNQKKFDTLLVTASAASAFATRILDYHDTVHATEPLTLPIAYYDTELGDIKSVEVWRDTASMLGTKTAEITGVSFDLAQPAMKIDVRYI